MQNLLKEKPDQPLYGRLLYSTEFLSDLKLSDKNILDIGCGYGWFEHYALKKGVAKIVATEVSLADLSTIRKEIKSKKIQTCVADTSKLPFPANSFDLVVSWEVLEHVSKAVEARMFSEIYRVLKPGGTFVLSTPFYSLASTISDPAWWLIGHRHYSLVKIRELFSSSGFKSSHMVVQGKWWELIGNLNMYFCKWVLHRRPFFEGYISSRINQDYTSGPGFMTLFAKFKK